MKTKVKYGIRAGLVGLTGLVLTILGGEAIKNKIPESAETVSMFQGAIYVVCGYGSAKYYSSRTRE